MGTFLKSENNVLHSGMPTNCFFDNRRELDCASGTSEQSVQHTAFPS